MELTKLCYIHIKPPNFIVVQMLKILVAIWKLILSEKNDKCFIRKNDKYKIKFSNNFKENF